MLLNSSLIIGISKKKTARAKIFLKKGTGLILVNRQLINVYFKNLGKDAEQIQKPYLLLKIMSIYDLDIFVKGGGLNSQLNASIFALSKGLAKINSTYRLILKKELLLRNDSRIKERRKYGLKKARKASQYSKR